jgi:NAD(P)H-nitrite reductase large subunit
MIEDVVRANKPRTVEEVTNYTKAGGGCSACHEGIEEILAKVAVERPALRRRPGQARQRRKRRSHRASRS